MKNNSLEIQMLMCVILCSAGHGILLSHNLQHWLNGTLLPKDVNVTFSMSVNSAIGMLGKMDKEHFGEPTPLDFPGYNTPGFQFAFWSSDELTYSSVILALTQCQYLFD